MDIAEFHSCSLTEKITVSRSRYPKNQTDLCFDISCLYTKFDHYRSRQIKVIERKQFSFSVTRTMTLIPASNLCLHTRLMFTKIDHQKSFQLETFFFLFFLKAVLLTLVPAPEKKTNFSLNFTKDYYVLNLVSVCLSKSEKIGFKDQ